MMLFHEIVAAFAVFVFAGASASTYKPDVIHLPTGFFPEGIVIGRDWDVYVGSFGDTDGRIWKGDLKTGKGGVVVPEVGSAAVGLAFDKRTEYLYVCGGYAGTARVYDNKFDLVANVTLGFTDGTSFVNDVIITEDAAYFTDSTQPQYYKLPLNRSTGELDTGATETIALSDGFVFDGEVFNSNGIEASDDGNTLLVVNIGTGVLYKVEAATGVAAPVDLGGVSIPGSDGLVLRRNTLWAVQNGFFESNEQIIEISLSANFSCGSVSPRVLTSELFDTPATAARKNNALYVVNLKFNVAEEDIPETEYEIVRVDRDGGELGYCGSA